MTDNLYNLEEGGELNPFSYNPADYPPVEDLVNYILTHRDKPPVTIDLQELSVNGILLKDSMSDYLDSKNISSSNAKAALKSPRTFFYDYNKVLKEKPKEYFKLGTFAHMAFGEPDKFKKVIVEPTCSQSSIEGVLNMIRFYESVENKPPTPTEGMKFPELKEYRNRLLTACEKKGYEFVSEEMYDIIRVLEKNYYWYGGGILECILKGAVSEVSFYGHDEQTGLPVRVRPDFFNIAENIGVNAVISLKTTKADDVGKFAYDCAKLKYEVSEGMYQEVMTSITGRPFNVTIMVMLQTVPPYDVAVLYWHPEDLENGKYKYHYALSVINEAKSKNLYPGFDALAEEGTCGIIEFKLPEWSKKLIHPVSIDN